MQNQKLPIHDMDKRHEGLTENLARTNTEGARVCLDRHHTPDITVTIRDEEQQVMADVEWEVTDERTRGAWANTNDATEKGACACVIAAVELVKGLVTISRAETGTGCDYYVALPGVSVDDIEEHIRLEVSGVDRGTDSEVRSRLNDKLNQLRRGGNLPGIAGVIGFRAKLILLENLETV